MRYADRDFEGRLKVQSFFGCPRLVAITCATGQPEPMPPLPG